jgi:ABC-2 type transport system permease protein
MMKALHIASKDLKQAFRSLFAIAFMFVIPILITGLFAFLFGGSGDDDTEAAFEPIAVQIHNQDEGQLGQLLVDLWSNEGFSDLLSLTIANDSDSARQAVDQQEAEVAILIPVDFSAVLFTQGEQTAIELYQDPTLTLGPGIVASLVSQFVDTFNGSNIVVQVAREQMGTRGYTLTPEEMQALAQDYGNLITTNTAFGSLVMVESPGGEQQDAGAGVKGILGFIMGGMMIFYAYFTGAYASNTILTEEENGTLARLFSTATPSSVIITGKLLAAASMILVQLVVLLSFGRLVFGIQWGQLSLLALFVLAVTFGAAAFGMFVISLAKDRKQAGAIMGAGITVTGMLGMAGVFMLSSPTPNAAIDAMTLLVPQGWANRMFLSIMEGLSLERTLWSLLGLLVYSTVMAVLGFIRFQKRFA